ncbi:MAG TPA: hypothetical protein VN493_29950 [Thermoanaerobaculia bacterium]|nr:hypothetical protein [Thermoanaerobaculia bacterium]
MRLFPVLVLPVLYVLCTACANGETAPPPPEPLAKPLTTVPTPGAEARREKTESLICFPELPPGAEQALLGIQTAAEAGDLEALRRWLAPGTGWSFDPEALRELAATLDRGCLEDETGQRVLCPPEHRSDPDYPGWRAGIQRRPEGWRLIYFAAGV